MSKKRINYSRIHACCVPWKQWGAKCQHGSVCCSRWYRLNDNARSEWNRIQMDAYRNVARLLPSRRAFISAPSSPLVPPSHSLSSNKTINIYHLAFNGIFKWIRLRPCVQIACKHVFSSAKMKNRASSFITKETSNNELQAENYSHYLIAFGLPVHRTLHRYTAHSVPVAAMLVFEFMLRAMCLSSWVRVARQKANTMDEYVIRLSHVQQRNCHWIAQTMHWHTDRRRHPSSYHK